MTPDAAGRPEPNTHDFGWIGLNEYPDLYRAMRDRALAAESEVTRLRAEVEALREMLRRWQWSANASSQKQLMAVWGQTIDRLVTETSALLAARKGEG